MMPSPRQVAAHHGQAGDAGVGEGLGRGWSPARPARRPGRTPRVDTTDHCYGTTGAPGAKWPGARGMIDLDEQVIGCRPVALVHSDREASTAQFDRVDANPRAESLDRERLVVRVGDRDDLARDRRQHDRSPSSGGTEVLVHRRAPEESDALAASGSMSRLVHVRPRDYRRHRK